MNEHPEVGRRVMIYFRNTERNINGNHDGIWDGEKWLFRKIYTIAEYEVPPAHFELTGWEDSLGGREAYSK